MNYIDNIIKQIDSLKLKYEQSLIVCKIHFSEEPVHDFRVSIRRYLALIDFLNSIEPNDYLVSAKTLLKGNIKSFNPLRDTQVQIITVRAMMYSFPVMYKYYSYLISKERKIVLKVMNEINNLDIEELSGLILFYKLQLKKNIYFNNLFPKGLKEKVINTYEDVMFKSSKIVVDDLKTVHDLRLAFKSFRYTMEIYNTFNQIDHDEFKKMKQIQYILGSIQDNRVLSKELNKYIYSNNDTNKESFQLSYNRIMKKREKLISELMNQIVIIESFEKLITSLHT